MTLPLTDPLAGFSRCVRHAPQRTAVVDAATGASITYSELDERAACIATALLRRGVKPDDVVAVATDRSPNLPIAILGVMKAGAAFLPLNSRMPFSQVPRLCSRLGVGIAVLSKDSNLLAAVPPTVTRLFTEAVDIGLPHGDALARRKAHAQGLAYVIHTSGSTGTPKGVGVSGAALANRLAFLVRSFALGPKDTLLAVTSPGFDISILEILLPLVSGARVMIAPGPDGADLAALQDLLRTREVTALQATPTIWKAILEDERYDVSHLKALCGGEMLRHDLAKILQQRTRVAWNLYGPTEATIWSTLREIETTEREGVVGKPIGGTTVHVLDDVLKPVPSGTVGDVYLGGAGLARGYLGEPGLTASAFIPDPFGGEAGSRLYRTGDIGRFDSQGNLVLLGRRDNQVKLRGQRIELEGIESVLAGHGTVRDCAVSLHKDLENEELQLVAFVVPRYEGACDPSELRAHLQGLLPLYMVPTRFYLLPALPRTSAGKLDRRALLLLKVAPLLPSHEYVAPSSATELAVAAIWSELLGVAQVGCNDNFFDLGGHSLLATRCIARLRKHLGAEVPLSLLFQSRDLAQFASALGDLEPQPAIGLDLTVRRPGQTHFPLTFSQERVWFLQNLFPENRAYQYQATFDFLGPLSTTVLQDALEQIVRRHEIYRTTFAMDDESPRQVVHEPFRPRVELVDLTLLSESARKPELERRISSLLHATIPVTTLPLVRWHLFRLSFDHHVLLHIEHHLLHDGWSAGIFLQELARIYSSRASGGKLPPPPLPKLQAGDAALWQRERANSDVMKESLAYWKEALRGAIPTELPLDRARPKLLRLRGGAPRSELPELLCESLRDLARSEQVTPYAVYFAAFLLLLHRHTGEDDLTVGTDLANRPHPDLEAVIGLVLNNAAIRVQIDRSWTFRDLLRATWKAVQGALSHQEVPFAKVVAELSPVRDTSRNPLFQLMFGFHDAPLPDLVMDGVAIRPREILSNGTAKMDLGVIVMPWKERLPGRRSNNAYQGATIVWEYASDLFEETTILRLASRYETLLDAIVKAPELPLGTLSLGSDCDHSRKEGTRTTPPAQILSVTQTISTVAEAQPARLAIEGLSRKWTYRELADHAGALAQALEARGVGEDQVVLLSLSRPEHLALGVLGVLGAGGCCLCVNPADPPQRAASALSHAKPCVTLTEGGSAALGDIVFDEVPDPCTSRRNRTHHSDALAFLFSTSGTTGHPKVAMLSHREIDRHCVAVAELCRFTSHDRVLQTTWACFDPYIEELLPPLLCGATVVTVPALPLDAEELHALVLTKEITAVSIPTSAWHFLAEAWLAECRKRGPGRLRLIIVGGETLRAHLQAGWNLGWGAFGITLVNAYGPVEATVTATTFCVAKTSTREFAGSSLPVGMPIPPRSVYLLDDVLKPVPSGAVGDVYLGGAGLARGYLGEPGLTASAFIPDPFGGEAGSRLYRTGDIGRFDSQGNLVLLGRRDNQVKLRGQRIELEGIESVLAGHGTVRDCAVSLHKDLENEELQLVAFVVPRYEGACDPSELRAHLQGLLPLYMVPTRFYLLPALPRTSAGKLDRRALLLLKVAPLLPSHEYVAPSSATELAVAAIWSELLGVAQVGCNDNFFDLGGHSLLATRCIARLRKHLGAEVPLSLLFQSRDLAQFTRLIARHQHLGGDAGANHNADQRAEIMAELAGRLPGTRLDFHAPSDRD